MLSWGRKNPSLQNKNDAVSTKKEWNRKTDSLASDFEAFKKFVTEELFSLKTCVKTVKQLNRSIDQPISWQYSKTSKPVPYQKKHWRTTKYIKNIFPVLTQISWTTLLFQCWVKINPTLQ